MGIGEANFRDDFGNMFKMQFINWSEWFKYFLIILVFIVLFLVISYSLNNITDPFVRILIIIGVVLLALIFTSYIIMLFYYKSEDNLPPVTQICPNDYTPLGPTNKNCKLNKDSSCEGCPSNFPAYPPERLKTTEQRCKLRATLGSSNINWNGVTNIDLDCND